MKKILVSLLIVISGTVAAQNFYIAHRGASYDAPENTVAAAKLAWQVGADAVEVDLHLASDNRVVIIHDKDTKRTCPGKNLVVKTTPSMVLRDLDAGSWKDPKFKGEKIPYLTEIVATVPDGKTLVAEIKCGSEIIPHLRREIERSGKLEQIVFISFGWETIRDLKKEFPQNKCYWLSGSKADARKKLNEVAEAGLDGVNLHYQAISDDLIAAAKELNLEVLAWTVDDPAEAKRLTALGVNKITTNRPNWLKEQVEGK